MVEVGGSAVGVAEVDFGWPVPAEGFVGSDGVAFNAVALVVAGEGEPVGDVLSV